MDMSFVYEWASGIMCWCIGYVHHVVHFTYIYIHTYVFASARYSTGDTSANMSQLNQCK